MKHIKKLFAAIIAVAMILACLPAIPAFAETYNGKCGYNVTWSLDTDTGVLTISGSGDMYDEWFKWGTETPWFSQRQSIKSVYIENGVTSIGGYAFHYCENITSISIPDSVNRIGYFAFDDTAYYKNPDNWENDVLYIGNHLIKAKSSISGSYTVRTGTKTIVEYAFWGCTSLTSIIIPPSVTSIGGGEYTGYSNLTICGFSGSYAEKYANKNKINFIAMDEKGRYIGKCGENAEWMLDADTGILTISGSGVLDQSPWNALKEFIKSVNIENGITGLGKNAFRDCTNLVIANMPSSVTAIDDWAFYGCSNLENVTIANGIEKIGYMTFYGCSSLTDINLPETLKSIDYNAFSCSGLESLVIPNGVITIGDSAFSECKNLTSITIPASVTRISDNTFYGCNSLTSVTMDNSVTSIGDWAFYDCISLNSINIPYGIKKIGYMTFYGCSSLTYISLPETLKSIDYNAFSCSGLTSVIIPEGCLSIGDAAFSECKNLTSITIPASVNQISDNAFYGCENLTIKCYKDSFAYNYALNNIPYIIIKNSASAPSAPVVVSKTYNSVTLAAVLGYEYKMDNGEWQDSYMFSGLNPNEKHTFYQRVKETETTYASESSLGTEVTTLKMTVAAPSAPTVESKTHNSVTLAATNGYEYKMDNGEWQSSNVFSGLNPNEKHTFYQRVKETETTYASESSLGKDVTTDKMTVPAPKAPTVESKTSNSVTLKKLSGYEYSKDGKNWQSSNVFKNLKAETEYTFYQRKAETDTSYASDKSVALKVKTMPKESLMNENGVWYYTVNDQKVNATTLVNYYGTWYYVEKGKVNWKCDTLCNYGGTYYYVKNGQVDWNCNTLCNYGNTWYYVQKGKLNWNATTLCKYGNTWYYVQKGKVNWNATTLCNYGGTWYYVEKGKVNFNATTLCKYGNTWYYVQKGKVNFNATTLCKYGNTWYYVQNGKVNFSATLRFKYYGTYYNVRNGVVIF